MKAVAMSWTPSASTGVQEQKVAIHDAESGEIYGQAALSPTALRFTASVPEGVIVQGSVTTIRGDERVTDVSDSVEVGYGPLQGVTNLFVGVASPK